MKGTVLIVDDERNIRRSLRMILSREGFTLLEATSLADAREALGREEMDAVLLDVRLPDGNGLDLLSELRVTPATRELPVIVISGHASLEDAAQAVRSGATDFFQKPLDRDRVLVSVRNAVRTRHLARELDRLRSEGDTRFELLGDSPPMRALRSLIEKVAPTDATVLVTGESGTGKELVARALHRLGRRADGPFVKVNCAAIPRDLIESELFGHERGAFTGAAGRKRGVFEQADGGTLFLDEIGDMALETQAKVLRVIQSRELVRVGGERSLQVDVRIVAATHRDLKREVTEGRFREDLFYRLDVVPLHTPPLRDRPEDVPLLARAFFEAYWREVGMRPKPVDPEVFEALAERPWPGNVRELRNAVERMAILSGTRVTLQDIPDPPPQRRAERPARSSMPPLPSTPDAKGRWPTLREYREMAERAYVLDTLERCDWNVSRAARQLGLERTNLHKKMRALGIRRAARAPRNLDATPGTDR